MTFPTSVNGVQAPAVAGDFADNNGRASVDAGPGAFIAGASGLTIANFAWADSSQTNLNSFGSGAPTGFVARQQQGLITAYLAENSMVVQPGMAVTAYSSGSFWVRNAGTVAATVGMKAYADNGTGAVSFNVTGTPPASASVTGAVVANVGTAAIAANTATASIAGQIMTVSAVGAGSVLAATQSVTGTNVAAGTVILNQLSGTAGGTGTYTVSINQTAASGAVTMSGGGMTVSAMTTGTYTVGQTLTGTGVVAGTTILALGTGTGGTGTYAVSNATVVASTAITASGGTLTVSAVGSGTLVLNDTITGGTVAAGTYVTKFLTGTGGTGTYLVSTGTASTSATLTVAAATETKWIAVSAGAVGELVKMSSFLLG